jgi:hypothetical protein
VGILVFHVQKKDLLKSLTGRNALHSHPSDRK